MKDRKKMKKMDKERYLRQKKGNKNVKRKEQKNTNSSYQES